MSLHFQPSRTLPASRILLPTQLSLPVQPSRISLHPQLSRSLLPSRMSLHFQPSRTLPASQILLPYRRLSTVLTSWMTVASLTALCHALLPLPGQSPEPALLPLPGRSPEPALLPLPDQPLWSVPVPALLPPRSLLSRAAFSLSAFCGIPFRLNGSPAFSALTSSAPQRQIPYHLIQ